jgi:DNA-binding transcriptional ArsR family regulator
MRATLAALEDDTRRRVVEALAQRRMSAGELASQLDVTPAFLTRHLRVLRDASIVGVSLDAGDNRRHVYELRLEPLHELRNWADDIAAFWGGQLAAFVDHAEDPSTGGSSAPDRSPRRAGR